MAKARRCDVCKKYYDIYYHDNSVSGPNTVRLLRKELDDSAYNCDTFDVCPECLKAVIDILYTKKRSE